jgi:hypothetical protein
MGAAQTAVKFSGLVHAPRQDIRTTPFGGMACAYRVADQACPHASSCVGWNYIDRGIKGKSESVY